MIYRQPDQCKAGLSDSESIHTALVVDRKNCTPRRPNWRWAEAIFLKLGKHIIRGLHLLSFEFRKSLEGLGVVTEARPHHEADPHCEVVPIVRWAADTIRCVKM